MIYISAVNLADEIDSHLSIRQSDWLRGSERRLRPSTLPLLVAGIALANDIDNAAAADNLALLANPFNACPDLHGRRLTFPRASLRWSKASQYTPLSTLYSTPFGTIFAKPRSTRGETADKHRWP
jgi:hypothetical protein